MEQAVAAGGAVGAQALHGVHWRRGIAPLSGDASGAHIAGPAASGVQAGLHCRRWLCQLCRPCRSPGALTPPRTQPAASTSRPGNPLLRPAPPRPAAAAATRRCGRGPCGTQPHRGLLPALQLWARPRGVGHAAALARRAGALAAAGALGVCTAAGAGDAAAAVPVSAAQRAAAGAPPRGAAVGIAAAM